MMFLSASVLFQSEDLSIICVFFEKVSREAEVGKDLQGLTFGDNLDDENARPLQRQFLEDCQQESIDIVSFIRTRAEWSFGNLST